MRHYLYSANWTAAVLGCLLFAPPSAFAAEEPFDYFTNSWNVIGLKDYNYGTRITPDNRLLLAGGSHVELRLGAKPMPLGPGPIKQLAQGWLPIILLATQEGSIRYDVTLWAAPLPTVKDWEKAFAWPTEGENYMNWILVRATNRGSAAGEAKFKAERTGKAASTLAERSATLAPGAMAEFCACVPFMPFRRRGTTQPTVEDARLLARPDCPLLERPAGRRLPDSGSLPEGDRGPAGRPRLPVDRQRPRRAARRRRLLRRVLHPRRRLPDHGAGRGRPGDAAAKAIEFYPDEPAARRPLRDPERTSSTPTARPSGSCGSITDHRRPGWLERVYPQMRKAVEWAMKPAAKRRPIRPWPASCRPPRPTANFSGTASTTSSATTCGTSADALHAPSGQGAPSPGSGRLGRRSASYRRTSRRPGAAPAWPTSRQVGRRTGTHWGNTETLWPVALFAADDPRVVATIEHARKIHGGGFIEGTIHGSATKDAIHPTCRPIRRWRRSSAARTSRWSRISTGTCCIRSAAHAFPEGIFYKRRFAWSDTIPHVTGAANYALMLRHMLVHEADDELHLLAAVPDGWLADGREIRVERAPTHFRSDEPAGARHAARGRGPAGRAARQPPSGSCLHLPGRGRCWTSPAASKSAHAPTRRSSGISPP